MRSPLDTHRDATFSPAPAAIHRWPIRTALDRELPPPTGGLTSCTSSSYLLSLPKMWRTHLVSTCSSSERACSPLIWCSVTTHRTTPAMALHTCLVSAPRAYHEKRLQGVSLLPTCGVKRPDYQRVEELAANPVILVTGVLVRTVGLGWFPLIS